METRIQGGGGGSRLHDEVSLLLFILGLGGLGRGAIEPEGDEGDPCNDCGYKAAEPDPGSRDGVASGPFVVGKVPQRDLDFLVNVGEVGALVVCAEGKDAVLVWEGEANGVCC